MKQVISRIPLPSRLSAAHLPPGGRYAPAAIKGAINENLQKSILIIGFPLKLVNSGSFHNFLVAIWRGVWYDVENERGEVL